MKAEELAKMLMEHPDADVKVKVDRKESGTHSATVCCELLNIEKIAVAWIDESFVVVPDLCGSLS